VRLVRLDQAGSTNDEARQLALAGAPHGTAVTADRQTRGRGRLGRSWVSADGSLALSIVLRPTLPPDRIPLLCLAAAVATARCCGPAWRIAWPNDVVGPRGEGKVAGILAEAEWAGGALAFVVVGVGVNVEAAPEGVGAAALADLGPPPHRADLAGALVDEVLAWVDRLAEGPGPVLDAWRERAVTLGRAVRVGDVAGIAVDVDDSGALLVCGDDGAQRRILAGDVVMVAERGR
jgi:BirA family transcriptional regulator, biotin operon repressor / biotin---[acetyl-CoA-carboxylase] ligase